MAERFVEGKAISLHSAKRVVYAEASSGEPSEDVLGEALTAVAHAQDEIGATLERRREMRYQLCVVLPVGIERDDEFAAELGGAAKATLERAVVAAVLAVSHNVSAGLLRECAGAVVRGVVDDDDGAVQRGAAHDRADGRSLVERWDDKR